jgi:hypothetical protein
MMLLQRTTAIGLAAAALSLGLAYSAAADPLLPVQNLTFNVFTGSFLSQPKMFFNTVIPTDWSVGTAGAGGSLTYVGMQGSESYSSGVPGNIYGVYSNPGFTVTVPPGTNFFQADGNPEFENTIFQTVNGLTPGTTYKLTFQQAAGQQGFPTEFFGDTTEQWKVFLGQGDIGVDCSTNPCTVLNPHNDEEVDSPLISNPSQMNTNWQPVSLNFTANATSEVLTFLAWGDNGSTTNLPPTVFLEGVNTPVVTPEPASLTLLGAGLLGLGGLVARRRAKRNPSA